MKKTLTTIAEVNSFAWQHKKKPKSIAQLNQELKELTKLWRALDVRYREIEKHLGHYTNIEERLSVISKLKKQKRLTKKTSERYQDLRDSLERTQKSLSNAKIRTQHFENLYKELETGKSKKE